MKLKFKRILLCLNLILGAGYAYTQGGCGTRASAADAGQILQALQYLEASPAYNSAARSGTIYYLPLRFHIIRKSDGSGANVPTTTQINSALNNLNNRYSTTQLQFYSCGVNYIDNTGFYNDIPSDSTTNFDSLFTANKVNNAVNVFVSNLRSDLCGYGKFPWKETDWVVIKRTCFTDNLTIPHEIGHYFGLFHTHETANGVERVSRNPADGSCYNCSTTGDMLCDTEADDESASVTTSCVVNPSANLDVCGNLYTPPVFNIMSYYRKACAYQFTAGQAGRMLSFLLYQRAYIGLTGCDNCTTSYVLNNTDTAKSRAMYEASNYVEAANIVLNGYYPYYTDSPNKIPTRYDAGSYVHLTNGFHALDGSEFHAYIEGCGGARAGGDEILEIAGPVNDNNLTVYPNPTNGILQVNFKGTLTDSCAVTVFNALGQSILTFPLISTLGTVDMTPFGPGTYFITLRNADKLYTSKFILNN